MRFANARKTDDALRTAYPSSASPPDNINTTNTPARYSPRITDVTIEIPASKSEPNSRRKSFTNNSQTNGPPPNASATYSGRLAGSFNAKRSTK